MKKRSVLWILFGVIAFMACQKAETPQGPAPVPLKEGPVRGVWVTNVDSEVLNSQQGIRDAVAHCDSLGFNTLYVVTWNSGYTLYPSNVMEDLFGKRIDPEFAGRDPLREIIEEAHAKGIKVIAWFEFGFASSYQQPETGGHILETFPHWAAQDTDGKIASKNGFQWMNAFDPEVQGFILSLLTEVVENYEVDGIQGDDRLPALPSLAGYDSLTVAMYKAEHSGQDPPSDYKNPAWIDWRADKLNEFMKKMSQDLKAIQEDLIVSVAPSIFPWSKQEYLQDWPAWVENDWVDEVLPQVYRYDLAPYQGELAKIVNDQVAPEKLDRIFPGILLKVGSYVASDTLLGKMVGENRNVGIDGEVFFFYEGIKYRQEFFQSLYD